MFFKEQASPVFKEQVKNQNSLESLVRSKPFAAGAIEVELEGEHHITLFFESQPRAQQALATARESFEFSEREGRPVNVAFCFNRGTGRHFVGKSVFYR